MVVVLALGEPRSSSTSTCGNRQQQHGPECVGPQIRDYRDAGAEDPSMGS